MHQLTTYGFNCCSYVRVAVLGSMLTIAKEGHIRKIYLLRDYSDFKPIYMHLKFVSLLLFRFLSSGVDIIAFVCCPHCIFDVTGDICVATLNEDDPFY